MQIAIAGMKNVAMLKFVFFNNLRHPGQCFGQLGTGHGAIVDQIVRCQTRNRTERASPSFPQAVAFRIISGLVNITAVIFAAQLTDLRQLIFKTGRKSLRFDDQNSCCIPRVAAGVTVFDRLDNRCIHHFKGGGHNSGRNNIRYRAGGICNIIIDDQQGDNRFGQRKDAHNNLGNNAHGAFATHQSSPQIISGRIVGNPTQANYLSGGQNDFQTQNVIGRHTVFQTARPAGIFRHISAEGSHLLAGRIRCIKKTQRSQGILKFQIRHPRLHDGTAPLW